MNIAVSVLCLTYNQEKYIRRALDSFIDQKTTFGYEILVNDDCSTDNTSSIVQEYAARFPHLIKPVFHDENLFSKGIPPSSVLAPYAQGRYIAFCEGDDYWVSSDKLQTQFDLLEANPSLSAAAHANINVGADTEETLSVGAPFTADGIYGLRNFAKQNRIPPFATSSLFMRKSVFEGYLNSGLPELAAHGDFKMQLYAALRGDYGYSAKSMSAYRTLADGSINRSIMMNDDWVDIERNLNRNRQEAIKYMINELADVKQKSALNALAARLDYLCALNSDDYKRLRSCYSIEFSGEPLSRRLKIFLYSKLPSFHLFLRKRKAAR